MLKKFIGYYKPHLKLFIIDLIAAISASLLAVFFPYLTRNLLKQYIPDRNIKMIIVLLTLMSLIYLFKTLVTYIRIKWGHILGVRMEYDMRSDIFRHIQKLSFTYFDNVKTGHIMSRISNDLNLIAEVAHHAPEDLIISIGVIIGAFIFMFLFDAQLALISFIPIPLMLAWGWIYGGKMRKGFRRVRKKIADINSTVENSVQGIREVKSYANEELEISKFDLVNVSFKQSKETMYSMMATFFSGMQLFRDYYYLLVIGGGVVLIFQGKIDTADLLAFVLYLGIILPPIDRLKNFIEQFQQGAASFERFIEIMEIEPDIKDHRNAYSLKTVRGEIKIENVNFQYKSSPEQILYDIDMTIFSGEKVALVGESGAGKSTLVSLIPRFYEPQQGIIYLDDHNIMNLKRRFLRENIGIVQQNVFLFDGTIRENIIYGKYQADQHDLEEASRMANIYDFIISLPEGFDTQVGERGIKLSGGQKQRISIARVFLKNPPILIFDEATSSLDNESEGKIQEAMFKLSENRTTIIIAHRLSTVINVDRIYVLKSGRIEETGTHQQLLGRQGYYFNLYSKNLI